MPKNWKHTKKLLEQEFLCEKLRGHITYQLTEYRSAEWAQCRFAILHDGQEIFEAKLSGSMMAPYYRFNYAYRQRVTDLLRKELGIENNTGIQDNIDTATHKLLDMLGKAEGFYAGIVNVSDVLEAIGIYLSSDIQKSLSSDNPFIRILAVMDRRTGKRTLEEMADPSWGEIPKWAKKFYRLRFEAENIKYSKFFQDSGNEKWYDRF